VTSAGRLFRNFIESVCCPACCDALQLHLRVLDVGSVRVLTSVLAQSAALRVYEE